VALVERHLLGGDCLNVGCVPSKGIIRASRALFDARSSAGFGVLGAQGVHADFGQAMLRMRRLRAGLSGHDSARRFRDELGVDVFLGQGSFSAPDLITVEGKQLRFARAALCTGARAQAPPIPGLDQAGYLTNETVFSLTELPRRLAVIGGGPIGCELAQAFARLGSQVTLIEAAPRILGREDPDAAAILQGAMLREGITLELGVKILGVETGAAGKLLRLERFGTGFELLADDILVGVGRAPNLEGLGLEAAGIRYEKTGVTVSDTLQTSNPRVYAAGDICSAYKFTHMADAQARILIANALFKGRQKSSALTVPWCPYTDPEIAHVGLYVREARDQDIPVRTFTIPMHDVHRAITDGEEVGFVKIHVKERTDRILGATIVARHAGEMINEITLAIVARIGLRTLARVIHAYPTQAEAIKKAADAYVDSLKGPTIKSLSRRWAAW
jgi:pyruvate/2-oxoglutarate dehydrogenase complex dihydrolipoamide dehydrogenase (E3) component